MCLGRVSCVFFRAVILFVTMTQMQSKKQKRGSWSADGRMAVASGDKMHVL